MLFWSVIGNLIKNILMPTVNLYQYDDSKIDLSPRVPFLKQLVARELTCGELAITESEISVRILSVSGAMIGDVEIEIHAHAFEERVKKQDDICRDIRSALLDVEPDIKDIRVWLMLSELGHSW